MLLEGSELRGGAAGVVPRSLGFVPGRARRDRGDPVAHCAGALRAGYDPRRRHAARRSQPLRQDGRGLRTCSSRASSSSPRPTPSTPRSTAPCRARSTGRAGRRSGGSPVGAARAQRRDARGRGACCCSRCLRQAGVRAGIALAAAAIFAVHPATTLDVAYAEGRQDLARVGHRARVGALAALRWRSLAAAAAAVARGVAPRDALPRVAFVGTFVGVALLARVKAGTSGRRAPLAVPAEAPWRRA